MKYLSFVSLSVCACVAFGCQRTSIATFSTNPYAAGAVSTGTPSTAGSSVVTGTQTAGFITGSATLPAGPYVGATVTLVQLGNPAVLETGVTDARGHFSLPLPANLPANAVLRVIATGSQATLAAVAVPAAGSTARRLLAYDPVPLTLASTLAFASMQTALSTFSSVTGSTAHSITTAASIRTSFAALIAAAQLALTGASPATQTTIEQAVKTDGTSSLPSALAVSLTQNVPTFQTAFSQTSTALATAVHESVTEGATLPPDSANAGISFGTDNDPFLSNQAAGASTAGTGSTTPTNPTTTTSGGGGYDGGGATVVVQPSLRGVITVSGVDRANAYVEVFGASGFKSRTSSNTDGSYAFYGVPTGDYTLVVKVNGAEQSTQAIHVL